MTIYNYLKRYNISTRDHVFCQIKKDITKKDLIELYTNQDLSMVKIGEIFGCQEGTISKLLELWNISTKDKTRKCSGWNRGGCLSFEQRSRISKSRKEAFAKGRITHWNSGKKTSYETRKKYRIP